MTSKDAPGVIAPPPLIYAGVFGCGLVLDHQIEATLALPGGSARAIISMALALAGITLGASAVLQFRKVGTNVLPERPALALSAQGPYRFTRNPMYLGLALLYLAGALALSRPVTLLLLPPALAMIHFGVIRREERYLERKFGARYLDYKRRIRRWI